jgi:hypothetical protein
MKIRVWMFVSVFALIAGVPTMAVATEKFLPSVETNAPPKEPLANFDKFEFAKITMDAPFAGQKANEAALQRIQAHFTNRITPMSVALGSRQARNDPPRVLLIEPKIEKIKYIGTGARIWAGAMAGSSQVLVSVRVTDKATGELIANPEFYQRASGWGGAYTAGSTDNDMLGRITDLVASYLNNNLENAVGGPTGAEGLKN